MLFQPDSLHSTLDVSELRGLLSRRGDKITYLQGNHVCVTRAGNDPRGWRKQVDSNHNGTGSWQCFRPACDNFLRTPEVFDKTGKMYIAEWRSNLAMTLGRKPARPDGSQPLWQRGRPLIESLRKRNLWDYFVDPYNMDDDFVPSAYYKTVSLIEQQNELVEEAFAREPQLRDRLDPFLHTNPVITTYHLESQHYLLRRMIRLSWVKNWAAEFPADALEFVERHHFSSRRWHLINLWLRVPDGRPLFDELPQLAWLLASSWNVKQEPVQRPLRSLRSLVKKPLPRILQWLDLPDSPDTIDILRYVRAEIFSPKTVFWLCKALRNPEMRARLQSIEGDIDGRILYLTGQNQPVSLSILHAIHKNDLVETGHLKQEVGKLYFRVRKLYHRLGREKDIESLAEISSTTGLLARFVDLNTEYSHQKQQKIPGKRAFVEPDIAVISTSQEDWVDEGEYYGVFPNLFLQNGDPF